MQKEAKKYVGAFGLGFLGQTVVYFWGIPLAEVKPYLKRYFKLKMSGGDTAEIWKDSGQLGSTIPIAGTRHIAVWLKEKPTTPLGIAVLAHESLHAVGFQMKSAGLQYCHENDELICQMLDHLMKCVLDDWLP